MAGSKVAQERACPWRNCRTVRSSRPGPTLLWEPVDATTRLGPGNQPDRKLLTRYEPTACRPPNAPYMEKLVWNYWRHGNTNFWPSLLSGIGEPDSHHVFSFPLLLIVSQSSKFVWDKSETCQKETNTILLLSRTTISTFHNFFLNWFHNFFWLIVTVLLRNKF
jgi:hypothetical protein